ncbi:MAG: hypothetical protein GX616_06435 [Planctomycetes bacterium]|nr:hypothetical protein [Planctomycetota bacterium]
MADDGVGGREVSARVDGGTDSFSWAFGLSNCGTNLMIFSGAAAFSSG